MKRVVKEYLKSLDNLYAYFDCEKGYLVKSLIDFKWNIQNTDDISLVTYWDRVSGAKSSVIVKKNGEPMIFKSDDFTLIIAIDCVKTAFLLKNSNSI